MKAVILVGGEGTRLQPLTCNTPKALVPVLNIPFLEHVIRHLSKHGVKDVVLTIGHLAEPIESYFGDGSRLGVRLNYSVEDTPLGTAGGIKNAEKYVDDTFLALNGDIFSDLDISDMLAFHRERKAKATISLTPVEDPTAYGLIETDATGRIMQFLEKPEPIQITTNMINAGTYVLEPDVLARVPSQTRVSIERDTFPSLLEDGEPVYAYPSAGYWMDTGTPEKYLQLHRDLLAGKSSHYTPETDAEVIIGGHSSVHPTAQIDGPVLVGDNCSIGQGVKLKGPVVIGNDCAVLEDTVIEDSVIWHHVRLGHHAELKKSMVADHCLIGAGCSVVECVLGDNVTVVAGGKPDPGSRIWPGETVGAKKD